MSIRQGGHLKLTLKTRILLALDKFFRCLYPRRLNHWIFSHMDHYENNEFDVVQWIKEYQEQELEEQHG